jgi:subtilisin family serine protease
MWGAAACIVAASLALGQASHGQVGEPQHQVGEYAFSYFKELRPLELDVARVAVMAPEAARDAALNALGLAGQDREELAIPNVTYVASPNGMRHAAGIEEIVTGLSKQPGVFASPMFFDELGGTTVVLPDILIKFVDGTDPGEATATLMNAAGGQIVRAEPYGISGYFTWRPALTSGLDVLDLANAMAQRADVEFAEPDRIVTAWADGLVIPSDPLFGVSYHLHNTGQYINSDWPNPTPDIDHNCPEAWDHTMGAAGIIVAVLDLGIQQDHPDINQIPGVDTTIFGGGNPGGGPIFEFDNHGTPIGGIISGHENNGIGTCGIAPNCRSMSVKVAYDTTPGTDWTAQSSWISDGVYEAWDAGAKLTNNSYGVGSSSAITLAFQITYAAGVMHFGSAGNDSTGSLGYPASLDEVNSVSAITPMGVLASFSNWGNGLLWSAPGTSVRSTDRTGSDGYDGGDYTWFGGTSAASPCAAGVAALIMSADPSLISQTTGPIMAGTAKDLGAPGYDTTYGYGLPNAHGGVLIALFGDDCGSSGNCTQAHPSQGCENANCCYIVCDNDPFCCNASWDGLCAQEAAIWCYGCGNAGAGSCYVGDGTPACNDEDCCVDVCASDPYCCEVGWDGICVNGAIDICGPMNDTCSNAITVLAGTHNFSNLLADTDGPASDTCDFFGYDQVGSDIWYSYEATCGGELTVSTCNSANFDTKIAIYGPGFFGGSCPSSSPLFSGVLLGCNDDAAGCGLTSSVSVPVTPGETYKIRIGGYEGDQGTGSFTVSCEFPNETCGDATLVTDGTHPFSNVGADTNGPANSACLFFGYDQVGSDVWYSYVAACSGELTVTTCNSADFDTKIAIYGPGILGGSCPSAGIFGGVLLGCNDDASGCGLTSSVTVDITEGETYRIRIGGYQGDQGAGSFTVTGPCAACSADIAPVGDPDGVVGAADLGQLLANWGPCPNCPADIFPSPGGDDVVGPGDLGELLANWGQCP